MVAYRFCRPDDLSLLLRAVNECYVVHFPQKPAIGLEALQADIRELNLWPSNCMIAVSESDPISVCMAAKRPREVLVHRIATRPDYQRRGHAGHLLTSLGKKLAVLGPDRVVAEVPEERNSLCRFFEKMEYRQEITYTDFRLERAPPPVEANDAFCSMSVEDLAESGLLEHRSDYSWVRQKPTLMNRKSSLKGRAIASPDRVEAGLLYRCRTQGAGTEILALGSRDTAQAELALALLLREHCQMDRIPVSIPKLTEGEAAFSLLESLGFRPGCRFVRYAKHPKPESVED